MEDLYPFQSFAKMARFNREVVCNEKIDGTNSQILIPDISGELGKDNEGNDIPFLVGSRTRWITPGDDNYGFASWCYANKDELLKLGPGRHFGEFWGQGIQRNYGLKEKRFSLFNVHRWGEERDLKKYPNPPPSCCLVVPTIWRGLMEELNVGGLIEILKLHGSYAAEGFMQPEGIVIYHMASGTAYKKTIENDATPKSLQP